MLQAIWLSVCAGQDYPSNQLVQDIKTSYNISSEDHKSNIAITIP